VHQSPEADVDGQRLIAPAGTFPILPVVRAVTGMALLVPPPAGIVTPVWPETPKTIDGVVAVSNW
jgi:hypothetical protein